ncbi:hypothetical protein BDZ94DRAFT_1275974 [Collybia nuda]|uniref:Uncharacterized protein n=1 Tax=Collybia nuda TaxID=64659 RepID=A0A9P5XT20_9AGAR|nr:hypothetical protein BDZ94DRAFT_1275974 [Collybia nuda]
MGSFLVRASLDRGLLVPIVIFDVLHSVAFFILLVSVMVALFSRSVLRMKTWFSLLISWALYSGSFLILVGHQVGPEPPFALCTFQAGLVYGGPPLVAAASLIFVIEVYFHLTAVTLSRGINNDIINWLGLSDIKTIGRHPSGLYCRVNQHVPPDFAGVLVVSFIATSMIFEAYIGVHLYRQRVLIRRIDNQRMEIPLKAFFRMVAFSILGSLAVIMVFVVNTGSDLDGWSMLFVAGLPLAVALVFDTDILLALMFWRKRQVKPFGESPTSKLPV